MREERGAVYIFFIFALAGLMAVAGLVMDAANLYRAQLQLQKSVDAAVLAGIGASILEHQQFAAAGSEKTAVEQRARDVLNENLAISGLSLKTAAGNPQITFDVNTETLSVQGISTINYLLMDAVPFFILGLANTGFSGDISARASARRVEANVSLVLDVSDSMECPGAGACTCKTDQRTNTCAQDAAAASVNQRITDLQNAVGAFVNEFDEQRDRISLIPFNIVAQTRVPMRDKKDANTALRRGFVSSDFTDVLPLLAVTSNTNHCDALFRAYEDARAAHIIDNTDPADDEEIAYLFFTDGAPTAARLLLGSPESTLAQNVTSLGNYDYLHFTISHVGRDALGNVQRFDLPSRLIPWSSMIGIGASASTLNNSAGAAVCNIYGDAATDAYLAPVTFPPDLSDFTDMLSQCITDFGFHMPRKVLPEYGTNYGPGKAKPFSSWREQYYNCAVQASDFVREHRGTVYVVGLGPQAPAATSADPYQDVNDALSRKDNLLVRMARDKETRAANESSFPNFLFGEKPSAGTPPPFPVAESAKWDSFAAQKNNARYGRYSHATNSSELTRFFLYMAAKIKLRLIQ